MSVAVRTKTQRVQERGLSLDRVEEEVKEAVPQKVSGSQLTALPLDVRRGFAPPLLSRPLFPLPKPL